MTPAMHPALRSVCERFANLREESARLFDGDTDFRDLCEEFQACASTLARLESSASGSERVRREYAALLLRLERELLRYLEAHPDMGQA
jgi:hypothetical protein